LLKGQSDCTAEVRLTDTEQLAAQSNAAADMRVDRPDSVRA
jgi:hypothetical protein